jgi:hypothetical protein
MVLRQDNGDGGEIQQRYLSGLFLRDTMSVEIWFGILQRN